MVIVAFLLVLFLVACGVVFRLASSLKQEAIKAEEFSAVPVVDVLALREDMHARVEVHAPIKIADRGLDDIPWRTPALSEKKEFDDPLKSVEVGGMDKVVQLEIKIDDQKTVYESQIFQLKEDAKQIREKTVEQAKNALDVINKLRESSDRISAENEQLKTQQRSLPDEDGAAHFKAEMAALKSEIFSLKSEISRRDEEKVMFLQEKEAFRADVNRKIQQANESVSAVEIEYKKNLAVLAEDVTALRRENEALLSASDPSSRETEPVSEVRSKMVFLETDNARLKEKNEFLQYELVKVKAQSAGLQRICDNLRKKEEDLVSKC